MPPKTAVITMVRDDDFFLERWVQYYGGLFGAENLYVINHGNQPNVRKIAGACNLFPVPDDNRKKFTILNWRTKNHLLRALLEWYDTVIVCDVDEFVVMDPATGHDLRSWLEAHPAKTVRTALGLEVVHLRNSEPEGVETSILGPRKFAQISHYYAKPCIVSRPTKLSRGGHYSEYDKLDMPEGLYLFHMKFCDFDLYADTLNRRNQVIKSMNVDKRQQTTTNIQWFAENRDDEKLFDAFAQREVVEGFDFSKVRSDMHKTFGPRANRLYHFKKRHYPEIYRIPDRFFGLDGAVRGNAAASAG